MNKYLLIISTLAFLFSCEKEEQPIEPYNRGDVTTVAISTGNNGDYSKQIFYRLSDNQVVKTISRTIWDLGFEASANGFIVTLNSANKAQAAQLNTTNFDSVTDISGMTLTYTWDHSSGEFDSLALKNWIDGGIPTQYVYIIDRGENPDFSGRGKKKLQINDVDNATYTITYANIDGSDKHTLVINKDYELNNVCFSFDDGGKIVDVEPKNDQWDLLFTQYTTEFYVATPTLAYSVNGTLINRTFVQGVKVFDQNWSDIDVNDIGAYNFNDTLDVIGYDWKFYDMDNSQYTVYDFKNYLIKDKEGFFYKLRFVDFYDDLGVKGTPKFELKKL